MMRYKATIMILYEMLDIGSVRDLTSSWKNKFCPSKREERRECTTEQSFCLVEL